MIGKPAATVAVTLLLILISIIGQGLEAPAQARGCLKGHKSTGFVRTSKGQITSFAVGECTTAPESINSTGMIAGYADGTNPYKDQAFIRAADGTIQVFAVKGFSNAVAVSINKSGSVAGSTSFGNDSPAFVREADGTIKTFQIGQDPTYSTTINNKGYATGDYYESGGYHGFFREPHGRILTFDAFEGSIVTSPRGLNNKNQIAGVCYDQSKVLHGFERQPDGAVIQFDAAGAGTQTSQGTEAASINDSGYIVGNYIDSQNLSHGYLRAPDGTFTSFDAPGATNTWPISINGRGKIAGYYVDTRHRAHGFIRDTDGKVTEFDASAHGNTFAGAINDGGDVAGSYGQM